MAATSIIFSLYFIVNYVLILFYPILRFGTHTESKSLKISDNFGLTYQNSIIYTVLVLAMLSYTRSTSNQQFFIDTITVSKVGIACLLFFVKLEYCLWYILVCLILWIIIPYPKLKIPNKFTMIRSEEQFQNYLKQRSKEHNKDSFLHFQYRNKMMFFVEFYADWNLTCTFQAKEVWYGYSNKYATNQLKFLSINISKFPELAKQYQINTSGFSKQLPTVMILQDGEETIRFPPIDKNNKVLKVAKYDYRILLKYFDLESRYLQTRT